MTIETLQNRVIGAMDIVDYSSIVMRGYPDHIINSDAFVGFKVLCQDMNAYTMPPGQRLAMIDQHLGFLQRTGCIIRETKRSVMPDGFWVITMPVPRIHLREQINRLVYVLHILESQFGIVVQGLFEINVSGRCRRNQTVECLSRLTIPSRYMPYLQVPDNTPCRFGHIVHINDNYMCLRTRWNLGNNGSPENIFDDLLLLSQLIGSIYH